MSLLKKYAWSFASTQCLFWPAKHKTQMISMNQDVLVYTSVYQYVHVSSLYQYILCIIQYMLVYREYIAVYILAPLAGKSLSGHIESLSQAGLNKIGQYQGKLILFMLFLHLNFSDKYKLVHTCTYLMYNYILGCTILCYLYCYIKLYTSIVCKWTSYYTWSILGYPST